MILPDLLSQWSWQPLTFVLMGGATVLYVRGWLHMRAAGLVLASGWRLLLFFAGMGLLLVAVASPLYGLSTQFLAARTGQKLLVAMLAAPLLWQACPIHIMAWGLPRALRRRVAQLFLPGSPTRRLATHATRPLFALMLFISAFLIWHDPQLVNWSMAHDWSHRALIWLLFFAAMSFWWHVGGTAPRLHRGTSGWLIAIMLVLVEIPNMVSGVTIAFLGRPLYAYYETVQATMAMPHWLNTLEDQIISGALIWVTGSMVYISSLVLVVRRVFLADGDVEPQSGFARNYTGRALAPGLEHRSDHHSWD
jgi:putative membrane protein